jgi:hypothetical protein
MAKKSKSTVLPDRARSILDGILKEIAGCQAMLAAKTEERDRAVEVAVRPFEAGIEALGNK